MKLIFNIVKWKFGVGVSFGRYGLAMAFADQLPRRLEKLVRDSTALSRQELREAIEEGRVRVDGEPAALDALVFGDEDVRLDGRSLELREHQRTVLFHKPAGMTASLADTHGRTDLSEPLEGMPEGCAPVGRLDRETTGALLFTTDGDLLNAVLRPMHHVAKVYRLTLSEWLAEDDPRLRQLVDGVPTALGSLRADDVRIGTRRAGRVVEDGAPDRGETELWLTLHEGKNRQIRRMCRGARLRLEHLHRASIGTIALGDLSEGAWRELEASEVDALWDALGGRAHVNQLRRDALERQARQAREQGSPHLKLERWLGQA